MKSLPADVKAYTRTALFDEKTVPEGLLKDHRTKRGTWGLIQVEEGALDYVIEERESYVLDSETPGVVEPEVFHRVSPRGPVLFFVEFYRGEANG